MPLACMLPNSHKSFPHDRRRFKSHLLSIVEVWRDSCCFGGEAFTRDHKLLALKKARTCGKEHVRSLVRLQCGVCNFSAFHLPSLSFPLLVACTCMCHVHATTRTVVASGGCKLLAKKW